MVNQGRHRWVCFQGIAVAVILMVLLPSCRSPARPATPPSQTLSSPVAEISFHTTLTLVSKEAPDDHWVGYFGGSVDIDGDILAAGEPFWGRPPGEGAGAAYVFRKNFEGEW